MPSLGFSVDISGYVEEVDAARNKDIPFATAVALTRTAQDAAIEVRRNAGQRFALRNDWTQRNIKVDPARKLSWPITAQVFTDTGNASAPDYLEQQEDGGEKVPHEGHNYIAIPTRYLREIVGGGVIPAALRPKELLAAFTGTHIGRRSKKDVRTPRAQQFVGFKQWLRGELYIFGRRPDSRREAIPLYLLKPEVEVRAVLDMEKTVGSIAEERFEVHWDDAWDDIVRRS
jgi:hypothetical protein